MATTLRDILRQGVDLSKLSGLLCDLGHAGTPRPAEVEVLDRAVFRSATLANKDAYTYADFGSSEVNHIAPPGVADSAAYPDDPGTVLSPLVGPGTHIDM
jgi:hypothetical protein